jgi:uncharacterized membrane protein
MNTVFLGLAVALLWGSADTFATSATQRIGSACTTFVAQIAGFLLVAIFGLACAGQLGLLSFPTHVLDESVLWGIVLGGVSAGAYLTLYFVGVMLAAINVGALAHMNARTLFGPGVCFALISLVCFGVLAFGLARPTGSSASFCSAVFPASSSRC